MDQIVVDLGPNSRAQIGDEAVLFGRQGHAEISVSELADLAGTINYEMVCAVSARVPRVYINE
jgi:alanine racemase